MGVNRVGDLQRAIEKYAKLDRAIENALQNEVAEVVKGALAQAAIEEVYDTYTPKFLSRRDPVYGGGSTRVSNAGGGITDKTQMHVEVVGNTLTVSDDAPYQQLWGGTRPSSPRLAEAIATGDPRFHMEKAGPRPFHEKAKRKVIESGDAEKALIAGLKRQGIDVTGLKFELT